MRASASTTIDKPVAQIYRQWRNLESLPTFMHHLESVRNEGALRSHWKAKAPAGKTVEWEAEIIKDDPNEVIAWRSVGSADVNNSGSVRFVPAPGGRGTEIHVEVEYDLPGGALAGIVAKVFGEDPKQQLSDDLRRFKQMMELGEVVRSDGSPEGNSTTAQAKQQPAQPAG